MHSLSRQSALNWEDALKLEFDQPGFRAVRPDSQKKPVAVAEQPIAPGIVRLGGFAGPCNKRGHDAPFWVGLWVGLWRFGWDFGGKSIYGYYIYRYEIYANYGR